MPEINENTLKNLLGDDPIATSISVRIRQDEQTLTNLERRFNSIKQEAEGIAKALKEAGVAAQNLGAIGGLGGKSVSTVGNTKVEGGPFTPTAPDKGRGVITRISGLGGGGATPPGGGGGPRGGPGGPGGPSGFGSAALSFASQLMSVALPAMDQRIDRGYQYSLAADRMTMLFQQMKGMSQQAIQDVYRQPLTQYKLGAGGINTLLGLEATTGMSAAQQARSVEALRVSSGFSVSTAGAASTLQQLASPQVANRMFMMTGMSIVKPGGGYRTLNEVMQNLVKNQGLTDPRILQSAMMPGSVTRANLTNIGITGELQNQLIQYAQQNMAFKQRGGSGMYDPSNKGHQKIMGIENNFAMQAEETDRVRGAREEQFYSRQADNFAKMEKQTQAVTRALGALEDKLSGLFGVRTSTRTGANILGKLGQLAGAIGSIAMAPMTGGMSLLAMPAMISAGNLVGQTAGSLIPTGDPVGFVSADRAEARAALNKPSSLSRSSVTTSGMGSGRTSSAIKLTSAGKAPTPASGMSARGIGIANQKSQVKGGQGGTMMREAWMAFTQVYGLDGKLTTLSNLIRDPALLNSDPAMVNAFASAAIAAGQAGTIIGINSGWRSESDQYREFMDRYQPVGYQTDVKYKNQYYKLREGKVPVAVPGSNEANHQHGTALDVSGDVNWLAKYGSRFGLVNFADAGEPWHFQLADSMGRTGQSGTQEPITFGSGGIGYDPKISETRIVQALADRGLTSVTWTKTVNGKQQPVGIEFLPLAEGGTVTKADANSLSRAFSMYSDMGMLGSMAQGSRPTFGAVKYEEDGKHITRESMLMLAYSAGWRGEDLIKAASIPIRESGLQPGNLNPNNEYSIGLFQINVKDKANLAFITSLGYKPEDLYDPVINTKVAYAMYASNKSRGGNGWTPWGPYKHMHEMTAVPWRRQADLALKMGLINTPYTGPKEYDGMIPYGSLSEWRAHQGGTPNTKTPSGGLSLLKQMGDPAPHGTRKPNYVPSLISNNVGTVGGPTIVDSPKNATLVGGHTITVAPSITINASGSNIDQDFERMARKVAAMLEQEVNRTMMRRT